MKKTKLLWINIFLIIVIYLTTLFFYKKTVFTTKFDLALITRYFLSQDIPHEVPGKRLFLSDEEVYTAAGYLYINGEDPTKYSFDHPPLIKYLFGQSIKLFNNPLIAQVFLGALLLISTYFLALKLTKNHLISFISTLILLFDPLFLDTSTKALLDVGQSSFAVLYFISLFYYKKNYVLQGIILGLFAGSKFWITPMFFIAIFVIYKIYKKEMEYKIFVKHLIVSFITYSLMYLQTFILIGWKFNIIWHILRTFKFRLQHHIQVFFGGSIILFLSGYFKMWWGKLEWTRSFPWSPLWPISLLSGTFYIIKSFFSKKIDLSLLNIVIPITYLFYISFQNPFPRYFLITLPFFYIFLANAVYKIFKKLKPFYS